MMYLRGLSVVEPILKYYTAEGLNKPVDDELYIQIDRTVSKKNLLFL